jgi:DNA-binding response OmpR family regulator
VRRATIQRSARVAVVEDDDCVRNALAVYLEAQDYPVTAFASAEEALASGSLHEFQVVISDLGLPGEDGLSLLRRSRSLSSGQVTVLITGTDQGELPASARRGIDAVLRKPLSAEDLCNALSSLVQRRAADARASAAQ